MSLLVALLLAQVSLAEEGGPKKVVNHLNCVGAGITCSSSSTFGTITVPGGGGGAPANAQYWVGAADGTLSAEKNLGALGTGLVINTAGTPSAYAGSACGPGTFATATSASGALTCSAPTSYLNFITATVNYPDIAVAATTKQQEVLNEGIPAKSRITRVVADITQGFDDGAGPIISSNIRCGSTSGSNTFLVDGSIFTPNVRGDVAVEVGALIETIPNWSAGTDLWCQFSANGGNLNTLTSGAVTLYVEYIQYP